MLGRYVGGTLLILGVAMLMAPPAEEAPRAARESASGDASADIVSRASTAPSALGEPEAAGTGDRSREAAQERLVLALLDETPQRAADDAPSAAPALAQPEQPALADVARTGADAATEPAASDPAGPVPTLSEPGSIRTASITSETMRLIERAEERATPSPDAAAGAGPGEDTLFVTGSRVNVRSGPSTEFGVLTSLPYGEAVELLGYEGPSWARIRIEGGGEGYMSRSFLEAELGDG